MKLNSAARHKTPTIKTHEGAPATRAPNVTVDLRRAVMACLLWEDQFYESGVTIADRIKLLVPQVPAEVVAYFAIHAREDMKLRHIPLLLVREMARGPVTHRRLVKDTLARVIQRADELSEFLAIYWKDGKQPLSAQVKKGLAAAFPKFNDYALAKYNRNGAIKLRDVLFLSHAKPNDVLLERRNTKFERKEGISPLSIGEQRFLSLVDDTLPTPDTWEVQLSSGADKKTTFERLIKEEQLGALALLRNLRGMLEAGVSLDVITDALAKIDVKRVLPHRFIAAARAAPAVEHLLEEPMLRCAATLPKLAGRTVILVDVSGSMLSPISAKSDLHKVDAACGLAIIARELCEQVVVLSFSQKLMVVPARRGFALRDAILTSQPNSGTYLGSAITETNKLGYDRIIVITDEQSADTVGPPIGHGYMINVASYKNGVGYGPWNKIDGFSEAVIRYIVESEAITP